ncbi:hypothetical protein [Streptomyces sulfonofaciens]|nr:hypothetical protein [Streptomyces sulfonofaciens]
MPAGRHRAIAPDHLGSGLSDAPGAGKFARTVGAPVEHTVRR